MKLGKAIENDILIDFCPFFGQLDLLQHNQYLCGTLEISQISAPPTSTLPSDTACKAIKLVKL